MWNRKSKKHISPSITNKCGTGCQNKHNSPVDNK